MNLKSLLISKALIVKNIVLFLVFYLSFFLYQNLAKYDNLGFLLFVNISVFVIFLLTLILRPQLDFLIQLIEPLFFSYS